MHRLILSLLLAAGSQLAQAQPITCYTVRDSAGTLLEQSAEPPVDLSKPLSEGVAEKFGPNAKLVMWPTDRSSCPDAASVAAASPGKRNADTANFGSYQASHLTSGYSSSYDGGYSSGYTPRSNHAYAGRSSSRRSASSYSSGHPHRSSYISGSSSHSHYAGGGRRGGRGRR